VVTSYLKDALPSLPHGNKAVSFALILPFHLPFYYPSITILLLHSKINYQIKEIHLEEYF
jgi:hypothetical protein